MTIKLYRRLIYAFLRRVAGPILRLVLHYRHTVMTAVPTPAIIVSNHTTDLDPALVALAFRTYLHFVASSHITRFGFFWRLLSFVFNPILREKGKTDAKSGKQILKTLRSGGNVCLFAEGNRSYNGCTGPVFPATDKLVKASGATLITFRLTGGYFSAPRWGRKMRKGPIRGAPINVYTPQMLHQMSSDEINAAIQKDIGEDAYARQAADPHAYNGVALAEYIETALYLCPNCQKAGTIRSQGNYFHCLCGLWGEYKATGILHGSLFSFTTVQQWMAWQHDALPALLNACTTAPLLSDDEEELFRLSAGQAAELAANGRLELYRDALCCAGLRFSLDEMPVPAIVGRQTMVFCTADGAYWELKNKHPRSALKYQQAIALLKENAKKE